MKILFFRGGMGNQLFQYAYYRYLLKLGFGPIKLDSFAPSMRKRYGFQIREIFPEIGKDTNFLSYWAARPFFLVGDVLKKVFKLNLTTDGGDITHPSIPAGKIWIRGTWQECAYLDAMRAELLKVFEFIPITEQERENYKIISDIRNSESVSIHIRRGNYLNSRQCMYYADICTLDYYREAIEVIKSKTANPRFFVFSNDQEWVKQNLDLAGAVYVDWNKGNWSFRDMQLMSLCKHNVIANSTFSWWAAWLNNNPDKIVVTPKKWQHNATQDYNKLIPSTWIKVGQNTPYVSLSIQFPLTKEDKKNLARQKYFDFEVISGSEVPRGVHSFNIEKEEISRFKDRRYLIKKMRAYFESLSVN